VASGFGLSANHARRVRSDEESGFYEKNPGTDVSVKQMIEKDVTLSSRGLRLGNFVQIRGVIDEELEGVLVRQANRKSCARQRSQTRQRATGKIPVSE
jgi:hypothetical protein